MITEVEQVKSWVNGTRWPDEVFEQAWRGADGWVSKRVRPLAEGEDAPTELVQAVCLLTAHLLDRRNSPSGVLGLGDLGTVRVPGGDQDVKALIAPYRPVVFG